MELTFCFRFEVNDNSKNVKLFRLVVAVYELTKPEA